MFGNSRGMFSEERPGSRRFPSLNGIQLLTAVLGVLSAAAFLYVVVCFERITWEIAVWIADFLSSGTWILLLVIVCPILLAWIKFRFWRRLFRW